MPGDVAGVPAGVVLAADEEGTAPAGVVLAADGVVLAVSGWGAAETVGAA